MRKTDLHKIYFFFILFMPGIQNIIAQSIQNDSTIINYIGATKITDSLNSPIPKAIRIITIDFLIKNGKNPSLYYTYGQSHLMTYKESHVLFYFKIGALREIYALDQSGEILIGSPGDEGDAIFITYNELITKAIKIYGDK
jgi:hypothetical protein